MSHFTYLHVHRLTPDFQFKQLARLNEKLRDTTAIGELLDDGMAFIQRAPDGTVQFWDRECQEHNARVNVYACVGEAELKVIASHIATGHLLVCLNHEAGPTMEFWLLSKDSVSEYTFPFPV